MSGGTFDYIQYRIDDAVEEIKRVLERNRKTIQQNWDECNEEEREYFNEYELPWTLQKHPYWADDEAEKEANKKLGIEDIEVSDKYGTYLTRGRNGKQFVEFTEKERDEWNKIRLDALQRIIDEHNNSFLGPNYSDEAISRIREMLPVIQKAKIFLDRIDWLFAGDDSDNNFLKRINEDLEEAGLNES